MSLKINMISYVSRLTQFDQIALSRFGGLIGSIGLLASTWNTWIAFADGDVSAEDIGMAVWTAFNAVGVVCAFFPGGIAIAGMIGTITATVGLASAICSVTRSTLVRVSLKNGKNVYVYIS
jgi:hypothetical protein